MASKGVGRTEAMGVATVALLTLAPVAIWQAGSAVPWTAGASSTLRAAGTACALAGLSAFAVNIILGARLPRVDRIFGGLGSMYRVHRANGRAAYLLLVAHVCLIVMARAVESVPAALRLFTPGAGFTIVLGLVAFLAMTVAIVLTLYARLTHEMFVYVQRTFGLIFVAGALHAFLTPGAKSSSPALLGYLTILSLTALAAWAYRSLIGNLLVRRYDYSVTQVRELDRFVVEIVMQPLGRPLLARPGQFVFVTFYSDAFESQFHPISVGTEGGSALIVLRPGDAHDQFHPFSLTSPGGSAELSLAIKAVGDFTTALHRLEAGARARVEGPYGDFSHLNVRGRRQIWIAGGIGITPFLSMARSLAPSDGFEVDLYWGVNTRAQAYFADELQQIAERIETFRFFLVVEDQEGFISLAMLQARSNLDGAEILMVGPPPMERALRVQLVGAGIPERRIHSERFAFGPRR